MKKIIAIAGVFMLSACSTIMRDNSQTVSITSDTEKVNVKIVDRKGKLVVDEQTPINTTLKTSCDGYFSPQKYTITASKEGFETQTTTLDWHVSKWYGWGNLAVGGLIGYLIVDPITGDMYYLDEEVHLNMTPIASKEK